MQRGRLQIDRPASGAWNMAVDDAMIEWVADHAEPVLRFYQWSEPTLSLGYFQRLSDRGDHAASRHCPVVRRASGGGAIVHDAEMTYSLVLPAGRFGPKGPERLYDLVHGQLVAALAQQGIGADVATAPAPGHGTGGGAFLCFHRVGPPDLVIGGAKIAGSAQRRRAGVVLQHGSLLVARSSAAPQLPGIRELTARDVDIEWLVPELTERIGSRLEVRFRPDSLDRTIRERSEELVSDRFAADAWTARR